jgi:hypothetical protein
MVYEIGRKRRVPKTYRNIIIAVVVLLVIFTASGIGYVLYSERQPAKTAKADVINNDPQASALKPRVPSPKAPENAAVEALLSPVIAGSNTSITVHTNANSTCTISATYNKVVSKDSGLIPKTADDWGNVTWSWTIEKTTPVGTWPVKVICALHGKTAMVIGDLQVVKK